MAHFFKSAGRPADADKRIIIYTFRTTGFVSCVKICVSMVIKTKKNYNDSDDAVFDASVYIYDNYYYYYHTYIRIPAAMCKAYK